MSPWTAWMIAAASTGAFLFLWFRDVRRIMRGRKNTLESAVSQLAFCHRRAEQSDDPASAAVLARSERIYRQAAEIYNQTLHRPWVYLPAKLMRFEPVPEWNTFAKGSAVRRRDTGQIRTRRTRTGRQDHKEEQKT